MSDAAPLDAVLEYLFDQADAFEDISDVINAPLLHVENLGHVVDVDGLVGARLNERDELLRQLTQAVISPRRGPMTAGFCGLLVHFDRDLEFTLILLDNFEVVLESFWLATFWSMTSLDECIFTHWLRPREHALKSIRHYPIGRNNVRALSRAIRIFYGCLQV